MSGSGYKRPVGTLLPMRPRARFPRITLSLVVVATVVLAGTPAFSVTKAQVDRACAASSQALRDLEAAQIALNEATAELNDTYSRTEAVTAKEVTLRETVDLHQGTIRDTQDDVVDRAIELYMSGGNEFSTVFLSAGNVNELLTAQELVDAAADSDVSAIERLDALTTDTERLRGEILDARDVLRELGTEMEDRAAYLEQSRNEAEAARARLSSECAEIKAKYDAEQAAKAAAAAAARRGAAGGVGAINGFICPVAGSVSFINDWGFPRSGGRTHKGTDMFASRGTPLVAVMGGTVSISNNRLGGKTVYLNAGGFRFYYAHLDGWGDITNGQSVPKGYTIGYVGDTGNAKGTSPHLHFGIQTTQAVNPYPTVRAAC